MLKINNLQKKIIKISTVISLVMISSFFLINKVSAEDSNITFRQGNFNSSTVGTRLFSNEIMYVEAGKTYTFTNDLDTSIYRYELYITPTTFPNDLSVYSFASGWVDSNTYIFTPETSGFLGILIGKKNNGSLTPSSISSNSFKINANFEINDYLSELMSNISNKKYWAIFSNIKHYPNKHFLLFSDTPINMHIAETGTFNVLVKGTNLEAYSSPKGSFNFIEDNSFLYSSNGTTANIFTDNENLVTATGFEFYYSNHDIYWSSDSSKYANELYFDSTFSSFNEFNEDIDVTDISKIKINFELPEDTSNLEVDINWTFDNYSSSSSGYITTPYLEFKHSNGDITLSQDIDNLNGGDWFSDNYIATLLPDSDITEISLIVDTVKASGLLKVNFSSKFPYSISYEYTEEVEDYFITIDMDDYASISLIPKVYDIESELSSSISSPIYKYGIYDVEIWEDLETKKVIDRWDNHSTSQFIYPMYSGYKNCIIHFIKKEVDASERYIKFDSRYYSYVVKKYLNEEVIITNPNTNEDITIPDTSDLYKYDSPVDKRFSFNSFLKPIKFVFESITDFYNNYCPEVVQYFFYLIFAFFVILVLIKIFL